MSHHLIFQLNNFHIFLLQHTFLVTVKCVDTAVAHPHCVQETHTKTQNTSSTLALQNCFGHVYDYLYFILYMTIYYLYICIFWVAEFLIHYYLKYHLNINRCLWISVAD